MEEIQEQLAALRRRMARIDRKYEGGAPPPRTVDPTLRAAGHFIQDLMSGEVVRTALGEHFETERVWERHRRHGSVGICDLAGLPEDLLNQLSANAIPSTHPTR
jgi:hypothetical protein